MTAALSEQFRADVRRLLTRDAARSDEQIDAVLAALFDYIGDYHLRQQIRPDVKPPKDPWLDELMAAVDSLEDAIRRRTDCRVKGTTLVWGIGWPPEESLRNATLEMQARALIPKLRAIREAAQRTPTRSGPQYQEVRLYLECGTADALDRAGVPLKTGRTGILARVLEQVYAEVGLPESTNAEKGARRAIEALPEFRALPYGGRFPVARFSPEIE